MNKFAVIFLAGKAFCKMNKLNFKTQKFYLL